jgi:phosphoribosylglycinamide formyltransferase-1
MSLKIAVMASTMGTDLQAIIDGIASGELDVDLRLVFSNKECYAVERAENAGIKTKVLLFEKDIDTRESYDKKAAQILDTEEVELIVLVGYMRLFSEWFVRKYKNKIMNIHPSLLPSFPGMDRSVHEEVLKCGCKVSGCTIHFVDEGTDTGPIIAQRAVDIENGETVDSLKEKVQSIEKILYPEIIQAYAEGKISVEGKKVIIKK